MFYKKILQLKFNYVRTQGEKEKKNSFSLLQKSKKVERVILSHIPKKIQIYDYYLYFLFIWIQILQLYFIKKKKNSIMYVHKEFFFPLHPFVFKCLIPIFICYLFKFKYFDYVYQREREREK